MWPFRRKIDEGVRAEAALEDAERNLEEIKKRHPEVRRVSAALRDIREKNHLSQQIDEIIALRRGRLG
jgi:F0F1-type ATP synthase epsilon subunit